MRKIAFVSAENEEGIRKVMISGSGDGAFLFGYNTILDCNSIWNEWYENQEDADEHCESEYGVTPDDWISIPDPQDFCNLDYIMPVRIKGRDVGRPEFDNWETLINGKWEDFHPPYELIGTAMTGNEILFFSGLWDEFEQAKKCDRKKARKILEALRFDKESIKTIL